MIQSLFNLTVAPRQKFWVYPREKLPKISKFSGNWSYMIWNDSFRLRADLTASSGMEIKLHLFLSTTSTCGLHFPHPIILINLKYISVSFFFFNFSQSRRLLPLLQASDSLRNVFRSLQIFSSEVFKSFFLVLKASSGLKLLSFC